MSDIAQLKYKGPYHLFEIKIAWFEGHHYLAFAADIDINSSEVNTVIYGWEFLGIGYKQLMVFDTMEDVNRVIKKWDEQAGQTVDDMLAQIRERRKAGGKQQ